MRPRILFMVLIMGCFSALTAQESAPKVATTEDRAKNFVAHMAPKLNLNKTQKDSLTTIYIQYIDDLEKYHAGNNAKVITYMMKIRDDKVKNLLHDDQKFEKYLRFLEDIKNQREPSTPTPMQQKQPLQ
ncbi:MAG: hypothetical protein NTW16_19275 [Bacteroidetes bacterium]|nr:hypothetical protein [Bacteroidota bacterium]